jgi:hypothetical protein
MFKKQITYFVLYFLEGNSNNKYSLYLTSTVNATNSAVFKEHFNNQCINSHEISNGFKPDKVVIESIQMISVSISLFGLRVF